MQKSTLLTISGIAIAIGSCFALVASLFMVHFTQIDYFVPYHFGIRLIDADFFIRVDIIVFELFAFVFGLISAIQTLRGKYFAMSVLGASFLLVAGILFFANFFVRIFYPYMMEFSFYAWWWLLQGFFGFPTIFLSSMALIFIVLEKRGIQSTKKSNLLLISGTLMILCSIEAVFFGFMSFSPYPYETALNDGGFLTPIYSWTLSICASVFAFAAGVLLFFKKNTHLSIALMVLVLLSGLSLSVIFTFTIYALVWGYFGGLLFESPIIALSAVALVLAFLGQRNV
jgi:hypothetical protein